MKVNEAKMKRIQSNLVRDLLAENITDAKEMRQVIQQVKTRIDTMSVAGHKAAIARGA